MSDKQQALGQFVDMVMLHQYEATQRGALSMWTIFDRPSDFPGGYIARRFETKDSQTIVTDNHLAGGGGEDALLLLRTIFDCAGLVCITRHPDDDANIVEVWM